MKYVLIGIVKIYQLLPFKCHESCKYIPSCSNYSIEALNKFGCFKGSILTIKRILRCNPFSKGGYDPVINYKEKKMKKIKLVLLSIALINTCGCFNNDSMENINVSTSIYPIEYTVNYLYGKHSFINSIYPIDDEIVDFEVTDVLLEQYKDSDIFIFNGLSDEKNYVKTMLKNNKNLKIIDATSNMQINYSNEELWLDPNNLLTIANNIRKGFNEYIESTYLKNEVNDNYNKLKIELTSLDGKYYSTIKDSNYNYIIVSDDAFKFLEKYGINVISLDEDTKTQKDISTAKDLIRNNECAYIFVKYGEKHTKELKELIESINASTLELYTLTNLNDINTNKSDYINLMNENLENIKLELYK